MPMEASANQIFDRLGSLGAEVAGLRRDLQAFETRSRENNDRADAHRSTIHRRVDELVNDVGDLTTKVEVMETSVADAKAVTDEVKLWKQRGIGALFVAGIAGSALGGAVVGFAVYWWDAILRVLRSA